MRIVGCYIGTEPRTTNRVLTGTLKSWEVGPSEMWSPTPTSPVLVCQELVRVSGSYIVSGTFLLRMETKLRGKTSPLSDVT